MKEKIEQKQANPMTYKKKLAHELVQQFHGNEAADEAEDYLPGFSETGTPGEIAEITIPDSLYRADGKLSLVELMTSSAWSKAAERRNVCFRRGRWK